MIIREYFATRKDGVKLYRTHSDQNMVIRQIETDALYSERLTLKTRRTHTKKPTRRFRKKN